VEQEQQLEGEEHEVWAVYKRSVWGGQLLQLPYCYIRCRRRRGRRKKAGRVRRESRSRGVAGGAEAGG
jgi:hypothetical protein